MTIFELFFQRDVGYAYPDSNVVGWLVVGNGRGVIVSYDFHEFGRNRVRVGWRNAPTRVNRVGLYRPELVAWGNWGGINARITRARVASPGWRDRRRFERRVEGGRGNGLGRRNEIIRNRLNVGVRIVLTVFWFMCRRFVSFVFESVSIQCLFQLRSRDLRREGRRLRRCWRLSTRHDLRRSFRRKLVR